MAVESLPVEFTVFPMYDCEIARKTIKVELPSEYPDTFFDLTDKEELKTFVAKIGWIYKMSLYEPEIEVITRGLKPLDPDATKEEVKNFIVDIFKRVVDYREYVDKLSNELEDEVCRVEVDAPHYNLSSLLFLMKDRCYYLREYCLKTDGSDELCERYFKDLLVLRDELAEYGIDWALTSFNESIKGIKNTINVINDKLKTKNVKKEWLKEKLNNLRDFIDDLK